VLATTRARGSVRSIADQRSALASASAARARRRKQEPRRFERIALGLSSAKAKVKGFDLGRDPERAPLRWDDSPHGGFSSGEPWLPMGKPDINVRDDRAHGSISITS